MLAAGVDIKVVSETPGHSDTRITGITGDIYQPALDDLTRDAAAEKVVQLAPHARRPPPTVKDEEPTTPPPLRRTRSAGIRPGLLCGRPWAWRACGQDRHRC